ncbi:MAG: PNGase F N-terminal domain-containing protein [Treponema sp.]
MNKHTIFYLFMFLLILSCKKENYKVLRDVTIDVFKDAPIVFDDTVVSNGFHTPDANGIIRLVNGRLILKKLELPKYERNVCIKLKVRLVSNGDAYDRSGSIFILNNSKKGVTPIDIAQNKKYPKMEGKLDEYHGIIKVEDYEPCVEAMRFMTPFGVGYYSQGYEKQLPLPDKIDAWEKDVKWECDISHLYSLLEDSAYLGCWIDTWVKGGFLINVTLEITESKENKPMEKYKVLSLINTCPYIGQNYPDVFAYYKDGISVKAKLEENIKEAKLYYTTTGHGGNNGDEFHKKENVISLNGKELKRFIPWNDSCKEYRKWNPTSAVFDDGVASSDLSRSNWCPGSVVLPISIPLKELNLEDSTFNFCVTKASRTVEDNLNFWLISSYLVYK